jgi:hypothetical protein
MDGLDTCMELMGVELGLGCLYKSLTFAMLFSHLAVPLIDNAMLYYTCLSSRFVRQIECPAVNWDNGPGV